MKTTITILLTLFMAACYAQEGFRNVVELNLDYGITSQREPGNFYRTRNMGERLLVDEHFSLRVRHYTIGITRFFSPRNGLKLSFGFTKFGFRVKGTSEISGIPIETSYNIELYEWGISYVRRFPVSNSGKIIFEPGIRLYSFKDTDSPVIWIVRSDAFSASLYAGYEVPMWGNNFFTNIGLQFKFPLQPFSKSINSLPDLPDYYPYFIGLKVGINFQFQQFY